MIKNFGPKNPPPGCNLGPPHVGKSGKKIWQQFRPFIKTSMSSHTIRVQNHYSLKSYHLGHFGTLVWFLFFFQVALNILCVQTMSNPCSQCSRQFENDFILKLHIEFDHQAPKFWCDQCGKQFSTRWYNLGVYNRSYLYYIVKNIALEFFYSPNLAVMSIQLKYCCRYIYAKIYQISYQSHFHWIEVLLSFIVQKCMFYWKSICFLIKKWVYTSATGCTCNNEVLWV